MYLICVENVVVVGNKTFSFYIKCRTVMTTIVDAQERQFVAITSKSFVSKGEVSNRIILYPTVLTRRLSFPSSNSPSFLLSQLVCLPVS